jgi:O-antigen/teichoic acid export membrane protein
MNAGLKKLFAMIRKLRTSKAILPIVQLAGGSAVAQLITVLVSFATARIYTPEMFGAYTLLLSIVSLFAPVLSLRYDYSIVIAQDEEVNALMVTSLLVLLGFTMIIFPGLVLYFSRTTEITHNLGGYSYLVIVLLFFTGLVNILNNYNNRYGEYGLISSTQIIRTFIKNACFVIFGLLQASSLSLLLSEICGSIFGIIRQSRRLRENRQYLYIITKSDILIVASKYRNQPFFSAPAQLINSASYSLLNFFLSDLFGLAIFGQYAMSYRVLTLPMMIISANVAKVFYQQASQENRETGLYFKAFRRMSIVLLVIAVPMTLVLIFFSPCLFATFYGSTWREAGAYVQILAPMFGIRFLVSPLIPALIITGKQKLEMLMQFMFIISSLIAYFIANTCGLLSYDFMLIISILYSTVYLAIFIVIFKQSRRKLTEA